MTLDGVICAACWEVIRYDHIPVLFSFPGVS